MACSTCGNGCSTCNPCENNCCTNCCKATCLTWGITESGGVSYLRGRCPDGCELPPLNLCQVVKNCETCTSLEWITGSDGIGRLRYNGECGSNEFTMCDLLSYSKISCLYDVEADEPEQCDILMYGGCNLSDCDNLKNKWHNYHIPDACNDCECPKTSNGDYKVLTKNDCGCIEECVLKDNSYAWSWVLRDGRDDDPDWPFTVGSYYECIDCKLAENLGSWFGKTAFKVTYMYSFGIQHQENSRYSSAMKVENYNNFHSTVTYTWTGTPTSTPEDLDNKTPTGVDARGVTVQGNNHHPVGSWEWSVSRTILVPKGTNLYLNHYMSEKDYNASYLIPRGVTSDNPGSNCSRLHGLRIIAEPITTIYRKED